MQKNKITEKIKKFGLPDIIMLIFIILLFFVFIYPFVFGTESALAIFTESKQVLLGVVALMVLYFRNIKSFKNVSGGNQEIKKEVSFIKTDITEIKTDLAVVKINNEALKERFKHHDFNLQLQSRLKQLAQRIVNVKQLENKELRQAIQKGVNKSVNIFENILRNDFIFDCNEIECILIYDLKEIEHTVQIKKLYIQDPHLFLIEIKKIVKSQIENFIINYAEVTVSLINGVRRTNFEVLCSTMLSTIIQEIIFKYNQYPKLKKIYE